MDLVASEEIIPCPEDRVQGSGVLSRLHQSDPDAAVPVPLEAEAVRSWVMGPSKRIMSDKELVAALKVSTSDVPSPCLRRRFKSET